MNDGIVAGSKSPVPLPYGLLGSPSSVEMTKPLPGSWVQPEAIYPLAEARDGADAMIIPADYYDSSGSLWRAHVFTAGGKLAFSRGGLAEYLVVAGGGGGGTFYAGGGGGGGLLRGSMMFGVGDVNVAVGSGGSAAVNTTTGGVDGGDGGASSLGSITASGGAGGVSWFKAGRSGGSGGGGTNNTAGRGIVGQGNDGGRQGGGGGGGAGGPGTTAAAATSSNVPGGAGFSSSITGRAVTYAGGGTGAQTSSPAGSGSANTGRGGNGAQNNATGTSGGSGGSGIVVVRYRRIDTFLPTQRWDDDALAYVTAVQAADGGFLLEDGVRNAINDFVIGCKADGIWSAIRASCILMGARTLSGALVPLVGPAPTNNNFVSGDYARKTGLAGNGTTKYLNSNRNNSADPQNSQHVVVYVSSAPTAGALFSAGSGSTAGRTAISVFGGEYFSRSRSGSGVSFGAQTATGLVGLSRAAAATYSHRRAGATTSSSVTSDTPLNENIGIFARATGELFTDARLAFYSIGEAMTLATLDTRVTALYTAIGAAIP